MSIVDAHDVCGVPQSRYEKPRGREPVHTSFPYGDFESSKSKQPNAPCFADTLFNCFGCGGDDSFRFSDASISPKVSSDDFTKSCLLTLTHSLSCELILM